jgi:hypothetical protein
MSSYKAGFLTDKKLKILSNGVAAGATTVDLGTVDMTSGGKFDKVTCLVHLTTVVDAGTLRLRAYTCDDAGGTNPDLVDDVVGAEGQTATITAATSSNKLMALTIVKPKTPYVNFKLERATQNSTIGGAIAILEGPRDEAVPTASQTDVLASAVGLHG